MKNEGIFRAGTSGLVLPHPNKKSYPPEFQSQSRLAYYGSLFNSIEINSSFYKVPMAATLAKWTEMVPPDFRFTFKLWRGITHEKGFAFDPKDIDAFIRVANNVRSNKGCLLVQLPPSLTNKKAAQLEKIHMLLNDYQAGTVLHAMPSSGTTILNEAAPLVYLRYHGSLGDYRGGYSGIFLKSVALKIKAWQARVKMFMPTLIIRQVTH